MAWAWDEEWHIDQVRKMDSVAVSLFVEILEGEENGSSIYFSRCRCSVAATFQWAAGRMPLTFRPSITQRKVSPAASEEGGELEVCLYLLLSNLPHLLSRCVGLLGILIQCSHHWGVVCLHSNAMQVGAPSSFCGCRRLDGCAWIGG